MKTVLRIHRPRSLLKNLWQLTRSPYWSIAYENSRLLGLTEIDVDDILFVSPHRLRDREVTLEKWIEKLGISTEYIPLSAQVGLSLRRKNSLYLLEYLRLGKGIVEMDFLGTIFRDPHGVSCVLRLWYSRGWNYCFWSHRWPTGFPTAVVPQGEKWGM